MPSNSILLCTAFADGNLIASGPIDKVALQTKRFIDGGSRATVLIFDDENSNPIEIDFRGSEADVTARLNRAATLQGQTPEGKGPGRPKLGVVAREVTLLPTHWEWLNSQPGGASVALRKLVEVAKKSNSGRDRLRAAQESTYRFMSAIAGNFTGFEEATRALFAARLTDFEEQISKWPTDIKDHILKISTDCFTQNTEAEKT